jgi:hypothetical protein
VYGAVIAEALESFLGKLLVGAFELLEADHVWGGFLEPGDDGFDTHAYGVDVPSGDFHLAIFNFSTSL